MAHVMTHEPLSINRYQHTCCPGEPEETEPEAEPDLLKSLATYT